MTAFASDILMIRPACFGYNPETSDSNVFQQKLHLSHEQIQINVLREFDQMVDQLRQAGINMTIVEDTPQPCKPDAVFPNNWISFHDNGEVIIYPMMAPNRRLEKRKDIIDLLRQKGYQITQVTDLSPEEANGKFLEGTGSMVIDQQNKMIYACISDRTHPELLQRVAIHLGYLYLTFRAVDQQGKPIYHTNVMMAIGNKFAVLCDEIIVDAMERKRVVDSLQAHQHTIIRINFNQLKHYAGNVLYLLAQGKHPVIVISSTAYHSLDSSQRRQLESYGQLAIISIPTIEQVGGGSVRCMIAENFLPRTPAS